MKKIKMSRELAYILGLIIMPFSVALTVKADLGMSMIAAPTYIISEKISFITYGMAEYGMQLVMLVLMCIIIKKFRLAYLMSFLTAIVYGTILDFAVWLTSSIPADNIVVRIILLLFGMVMTSMSVAFFFNTYLAPCAYDFFVRVVGQEKKLDMRKWKIAYDISMLTLSLLLSFALFHKLVALNVGTVLMVALNGNIISFFSSLMTKHIEFFDRLPLAKYFED